MPELPNVTDTQLSSRQKTQESPAEWQERLADMIETLQHRKKDILSNLEEVKKAIRTFVDDCENDPWYKLRHGRAFEKNIRLRDTLKKAAQEVDDTLSYLASEQDRFASPQGLGATTRRERISHSPEDLPRISDVDSVGSITTLEDASDSPPDVPKVSGSKSTNIFSITDSTPDLPEIFDQAWTDFDQASTAGTSREAADAEPIRLNTPAEQPGSSIWGVLSGIFQVRPS